jgi:hypothetical protein
VLHATVRCFSDIAKFGHTPLPGITPYGHEDDVVWRLMVTLCTQPLGLPLLLKREDLARGASGCPRVVFNSSMKLHYIGEVFGHVDAEIADTTSPK